MPSSAFEDREAAVNSTSTPNALASMLDLVYAISISPLIMLLGEKGGKDVILAGISAYKLIEVRRSGN
jgi:hypothetical protein